MLRTLVEFTTGMIQENAADGAMTAAHDRTYQLADGFFAGQRDAGGVSHFFGPQFSRPTSPGAGRACWPAWSPPRCRPTRSKPPILGIGRPSWRWRWGGIDDRFCQPDDFFRLEIAGSIIGTEIGLSMPPGINPMSDAP
jgi:hypothetical protein